jgi:hypothetical protein
MLTNEKANSFSFVFCLFIFFVHQALFPPSLNTMDDSDFSFTLRRSIMTFNVDDGYCEAICRGFRSGILTPNDYANLCQAEVLDGALGLICISSAHLLSRYEVASCHHRLWRLFG